ncbi:unnamed protein product [Effrenium voratum]|nr:unnamed protein product [Effrenium voratum]
MVAGGWRPLNSHVWPEEVHMLRRSGILDFHLLATENLAQAYLPEFRACLDKVSPPEEAAKELTVHLRGQDLWGMAEYELQSDKPIPMEAQAHHWLWHQPPVPRKLREDFDVKPGRKT